MRKVILFLLPFLVFGAAATAQNGWVWAVGSNGGASGVGANTQFFSKPAIVDGGGNLYVTGGFATSINFGTTSLTGAGLDNFFLAKYDPAGTVIWAAGANSGRGRGAAICFDTVGNIAVVGMASSVPLVFGPYTITQTGGYIVKYSPSGVVQYASLVGQYTLLRAVGYDNDGNLYVAGRYAAATTIGGISLPSPSTHDFFIAKYSKNLVVQWVTTGSGSASDDLRDMVVDNNGDTYITGYFQGSQLTIGSTTYTIGTPGGARMFLAKIDASGNPQWAAASSTSSNQTLEPSHLSRDANGNLFVTGYFTLGTASFGNSVSITSTSSQNNSFIVKYNGSGIAQWARSISGVQNDASSSAVDLSGGVYVSGTFFSDTINVSNTVLAKSPSTVTVSGYIARYDAAGNLLNAFTTIGSYQSTISSWTLLPDGNNGFYAAGTFGSPHTFGSSVVPASGSGYDVFAARYGICSSPPPQPSAMTGSASVCFGQPFTYSVPPTPGATFYTWSLPAGWTGSSTTNSITATAGTSGNITVTANNTCGNSPQATKSVTVNPTPTPTITQSGLVLSTAPGQGTYQWYLNGSTIFGGTSNTYTATSNGAYYVRVFSNPGNCNDTSNTIIVTQVGIDEAVAKELNIFPQPNDGRFSIQLNDHLQPGDLRITNLLGAEVRTKTNLRDQKIEVEIIDKVPGIYFLSVQLGERRYIEKIWVVN